MKVTLEHIGIYAKDVEALKNWYCDVLGLKVIKKLERPGRPPVYFLSGEEGLIVEILPTTSERKERSLEDPGFSHIGLAVDNFDYVKTCLESKGIQLSGVRVTSAGWKIGYFKDPEGNVLEIVEK